MIPLNRPQEDNDMTASSVKVRCTWYEPQYLYLGDTDLVRVDPDAVIEVTAEQADSLLGHYDGAKFALADAGAKRPKKTAAAAEDATTETTEA